MEDSTTEHGERWVEVGGGPLTIEDVVQVARGGRKARLATTARGQIERGRAVVEGALADERVVYGISTGLGALSDTRISPGERRQLQANLLRSHASGTGTPFPDDVVRAALLLRAQALAQGYSGVRPVVIEQLLALLAARIVPVVPSQGSVGASGDLAPLAHLSLPLVGGGTVTADGTTGPGGDALAAAGIEPLVLEAKEALALINGTQITAALASLAVWDAALLLDAAEIAAAMSFEALGGHTAALAPAIQQLRPHPGQIAVAAAMRDLLSRDGHLPAGGRRAVQDRYTLRCIPQVLGPIRQAIDHVRQTVEIEINAVTDNPLCFPDSGDVISGGNFHGHPLALACDYLTAAIASLGTFTERRIYTLVDSATSGLSPFLTPSPGTNSGFMIAQYAAASLASESKDLSHPASVDSITTSAGIEDYNSMSTTAARKLAQVVTNSRRIVAIEMLCAGQALDLRAEPIWGLGPASALRALRERVPFVERDDVELHDLIARSERLIASGEVQAAVRAAVPDGDTGSTGGGRA
ncbi:MAG TPA: histidine ammonia-lyase [Thermomicrobiaceae bacterium]|nr:histidine ammonia-lyase [Thermomicrobiaceae bacterium]